MPDPKLISAVLAALLTALLLRQRKPPTMWLLVLLVVSAWNYLIHARAEYGRIHFHDAGHYYLGSRWFDELGYFHLYDGMLLALEASEEARDPPEEVRDLHDNRLTTPSELLAAQRFSASTFGDRWQDFRADVEMIDQGLGEKSDRFFTDHGYNPTPVWTWLARPVARAIPAGDPDGLLRLTWIDPLLLISSLVLVWWAWGRGTACLAGTYVFVAFGTVGWIAGSFGRYVWLALLIAGLACLKKKRYTLAGAALAGAAALRIFPALFFVPPAIKMLRTWCRGRKIPRRYRRLTGGAIASSAVAILGATATLGIGVWQEFFSNMAAYLGVDASNAVGFPMIADTTVAIFGGEPQSSGWRFLVLFCGLALATIAALAASKARDLAAIAAGVVLCFFIFGLGGYYYVFLVLPLLTDGDRRHRAAFFGVEAVCYGVHFTLGLEQHVLFLVRSLAVGLLLSSLWVDRWMLQIGALWGLTRPAESSRG